MAKVHESLRIDEGIAGRVLALSEEGESKAATYGRVLAAGLDALEGARGGEPRTEHGEGQGAASELETLRDYAATLKEQLKVKDEQIATLTRITEQAQTLHAYTTEARAIEAPREERSGFWARLFGDEKKEG